ncbi:hypothetical protein G7092_21900 [Mucilaginibacter sp. HC2]|uniref:hypothetical protein n=1 Tax=Mucilaginibacter inviolabilis TaxID=2714892 RepID=UPI00140862D5|nr:hypothetical protein [Mucilaginibacter inviolabilis]NHA06478.1 hypothetical protein [Mucilaginibacter inviolabilis]
MPKPSFKKFHFLLIFISVCLIAAVINSCKKDLHADQQSAASDPTVIKAKTWYENTYPMNNKLGTQASTPTTDLSQWIKPDWQHAVSYSRFNKQVIEMPVDPGAKFETALLIGTVKSNKSYSRNYFLLLNDGQKYEAYVMMVTADSAYVNNDLSKLSHNSYRKHDADFSGSVLYFTPKGEYVDGYAYKNGQLIPASANQQTDKPKVQSVQTNGKKTNVEVNCIAWYLDSYQNGVLVSEVYLYTTCTGVGEPGGGGSSSGGGNKPPPPKPHCTPAGTTDPPSDPGGFPEPDPGTCPILVSNIVINDVKDSCLKTTLDVMINSNLSGKIAFIINDVFNSSDRVNLTFQDYSDTSPNAPPAITDLPIKANGAYNETINLNMGQLKDASMEFKTIIAIHEILHAYMNYNKEYYGLALQQHQAIAQKYVGDIKTFVQGLYPTLSDPDAYAIILNGMKDVYKDANAYQSLLNSYNTNQANYEYQRAGIYGTPCNK